MDSNQSESTQMNKNPIEALSKEELINKYRGVLGLAKKAKKAKDELADENRLLKEAIRQNKTQKEADEKALMTMKEMIEEFTKNKLQMVTQLSELQSKSKRDDDTISQLFTENESLKRQIARLDEENETLLNNIDQMEQQLNQVNQFGLEQKEQLALLELEVNKLKKAEDDNSNLNLQITSTQEENKLLKEQLNETTKSLNQIKEQCNEFAKSNSNQHKRFSALKERLNDVSHKLKQLKQCKRLLLQTQYEYSESVTNWQKELIEASKGLCSQITALKAENQILLQKIQNSKQEIVDESDGLSTHFYTIYLMRLKALQNLGHKILKDDQERNNKLISLKSENKSLKEKLQTLTPDHETLIEADKMFKEKAKEGEQTNAKHKNENTNHKDEIKSEYFNNIKMLKSENDVLVEELASYKKVVADYQALNNNSPTEKENSSLEMHLLLQENKELRNDLLHARNMLQEIQNEQVEHYNQAAFENRSSDNCFAENEELKTQLAACKNIVEELEERYALKEREHADLLTEICELIEALKGRDKNNARYNAEQQDSVIELGNSNYDLHQIKEKLNKKSNDKINTNNKILSELKTEFEKTRETILKLEHSNTTNYDTVQKLKEELKKSEEQVIHIEQLKSHKKYNEELKTNYEELKKENKLIKAELQKSKKQIESLNHEIQKLNSLRTQTSVLNLEIEAAEKSLNDMSAKLATKTEQLETLQECITSREKTIEQLRKEIEILEKAKTTECNHSKELKDKIDHLQTNAKDILHSRQQALDANKILEETRDRLNAELADVRGQLSEITTNNAAALSTAVTKSQQIEQQYKDLKIENTNLQKNLKLAESALEDLRVEFLDYKVKAQSVLRKTQNKDSAKERERDEELLALRTAETKLQANIKIYEKELDERTRQMAILHEDNANLQRRNRELMDMVNELKQQNDSMAEEQNQLMRQQQAALKQQRLQMEQLDLCHKEQLQQLENSYNRQLDLLKAERGQLERQPIIVGSTAIQGFPGNFPAGNQQSKIDFLLMEREDAEGSEEAALTLTQLAANRKISASSHRSQHSFIPLDELLSSPMELTDSTVVTHNLNQSVDIHNKIVDQEDIDLRAVKERLQIQESRVRHLTALLAENEQDLAKLTQMNDMLKEELRRQERSVERQSQLHNSEYLKNVIIKFLTLNSGDERSRLIPVLNAILKLSRDESDILSCVARGQKVSTDMSHRSWSHFLPSWGGNNSN